MESSTNVVRGQNMTLEVGLRGHKVIDYDRKLMRKALNSGAAVIRKEARRLVARQTISSPGEFPGMQIGLLRRAIGVVSRGSKGGWVKIGVKTIKGSQFYPAFLSHGAQKINLAPRGDYIHSALDAKRETVRGMIRSALKNILVPR